LPEKFRSFKWFSIEKRYRFITPDERGQDVFAHISQLPEGLIPHQGMRVSYDLGVDRRGREHAINIQPI
jgi:CspA family cold shock protein